VAAPGVRVVTYIGDVFEESPGRGRKIADEMGRRRIRLIVLHDVADWNARRDAEVFLDLARRTGGCVLPFDANSPDRLREILAAVAVYAVGGEALLEQKRAAGITGSQARASSESARYSQASFQNSSRLSRNCLCV
jgi:hypothetical protein